ncbi:MAG: MBL fold metallo-hydrolase [Clostridia bacterium]
MALKLLTIASGSRGNCTYIASENTRLLVDAGVGIRRIIEALNTINVKVNDINGVLITHEHSDHISGLGALAERDIPVYAHERAYAAISRRVGGIAFESVDFFDAGFKIGDILVRPFRIPHDCCYPLGYSFENDGVKISIATDIGHITEGLINNLIGSNILLLEANHDLEMLLKGSYQPALKQRIQGANGHLSNDSAAIIIKKLVNCGLKRVILGHLSEENNYPELAFSTVVEALRGDGVIEGRDIFVDVALQNKIGELFIANGKTEKF